MGLTLVSYITYRTATYILYCQNMEFSLLMASYVTSLSRGTISAVPCLSQLPLSLSLTLSLSLSVVRHNQQITEAYSKHENNRRGRNRVLRLYANTALSRRVHLFPRS